MLSQPHPSASRCWSRPNALFVADLLGIGMDLQRTLPPGLRVRSAQLGDHRRCAATRRRGRRSRCCATTRPARSRCRSPARRRRAAADRAALAARSAQHVPRPALLARARCPAEPMAARTRRRARRLLHQRGIGLQRRPRAHAAPALRQPLAPREEGPGGGAVRSRSSRSSSGSTAPIPLKYRDAITAGVLEWNKAFEQIGFKNAVRVEIQPDDADFDTLDFGRASIRWMTNAAPALRRDRPEPRRPAQRRDPRRRHRRSRACRRATSARCAPRCCRRPASTEPGRAARRRRAQRAPLDPGASATYADTAAEQMTLRARRARGARRSRPGSPEAEAFVARLPEGRDDARGRAHARPAPQLPRLARLQRQRSSPTRRSRAPTRITGSVMEYAPINLTRRRPRERCGTPFNDTLGPYDYWAIEYAYKPLAGRGRRGAPSCAKIAARSAEPLLAYGTDEDNFLGIDPESLQFDLGNDVVGFAQEARSRSRATCSSARKRASCAPTRTTPCCSRSVSLRAAATSASAAGVLARQIGGVRTLRDCAGQRPRPADAGAGRPSSARRSTSSPAACSRPTASASRRRCSASSRTDFSERTRRAVRRRGSAADRLLAVRAGARPAALAARGS